MERLGEEGLGYANRSSSRPIGDLLCGGSSLPPRARPIKRTSKPATIAKPFTTSQFADHHIEPLLDKLPRAFSGEREVILEVAGPVDMRVTLMLFRAS